jgi:hypothetical protein
MKIIPVLIMQLLSALLKFICIFDPRKACPKRPDH